MKVLILVMVLLPFVTSVTRTQCKNACMHDYGVGGRKATQHDMGENGFDNDIIDCTLDFNS